MKIVVADTFPDAYLDELERMDLDVSYDPGLSCAALAEAVRGAPILLVRSTRVDAAIISAGNELSLIIRAGAGVNTIDLKTASDRGIYVANCPGKNSIAVAELVIGLMLALDRRIPDNVIDFRNGMWNKALYSRAEGLYGGTLGVVGAGQIGREVIRRAGALGMTVFAWSRSLTPEKAEALNAIYCSDLNSLVDSCRIVSIHLALKPETKGLLSKDLIGRMKPGTMVINTSRAEVVDEDALIEAAEEGRITAGIDVFSDEPDQKKGAFTSKLQGVKNIYVTHHIGASTEQAQNAVAAEAVTIVREFIRKGIVRNWVNRCDHTEAGWQLVVRHFDKPGVLANVMNVLKEGRINAEDMENVIFDGKIAACCTIQLDRRPTDDMLEKIRSRSDEVISATLVDLTA
jgi:D-3-phosphoglycerate dehydrogenase / 2-oxoglutarate reductase